MTEIHQRLHDRIEKDNPLFLTPTELSKIAGCDRTNIHHHIRKGAISTSRLGNQLVIRITEAKRFLGYTD